MDSHTFSQDLTIDYDAPVLRPLLLPGGGSHWPVLFYSLPLGFRPLTIDLRTPAGDGPHPLVVYVHGGGWAWGHPSMLTSGLAAMDISGSLLRAGFAVASISYRLSAEAQFPTQLYDCKSAIRYLRKHVDALGLDSWRFAAMGESAGGHLAAMLGLTGRRAELEGDVGVAGQSSAVQAVVDWYGPTDLLSMNEQRPSHALADHDGARSPASMLIGAPLREVPDAARAASPLHYVTEHCPPFLIHHGTHDRVVPVGQSRSLTEALRRVGAQVDYSEIDGADHCFWNCDTAPIMPQVVAFLKRQFGME